MRSKIAIATVTIGLGLVLAALLLASKASELTIEHVESARSRDGVTLERFCIMNRTRNEYFLGSPVLVEVRNRSWKPCFQVGSAFFDNPNLAPTSTVYCTFWATNLPTGVPLRLTLTKQQRLTGALAGFSARLKTHFTAGQKGLPLNPWDKNSGILLYTKRRQIAGETFVER
jgi:hypothetical protein